MLCVIVPVCVGLLATAALASHPVVTNPEKYKVVLENERVRVLEYHDQPGEKTARHSHPDAVLYTLSSFKRTLTFPDGLSMTREFKAGEAVFMQAQTHLGENTGSTETHVLIVELKESKR